MPSIRTLPGTTNKSQVLSFHPENHVSVLKGIPPTKKSSNAATPLAEATTTSHVPPGSQELVLDLDGNISRKSSLNNCM